MKRPIAMQRRRSLNNASRRRALLKKVQRKLNMRRQDFQLQIECEELAKAS